jgi:hypothetical protein
MSAALFVSPASPATIVSIPTVGPWHLGSTWVGGAAPQAGDDVILEGPVTVHGPTACASLDLAPEGNIRNGAVTITTLDVAGVVTNSGTIEDGPQIFHVRVGGDLNNDGIWTNWSTICTGTSDQHLSQSASALFEGPRPGWIRDGRPRRGDTLFDPR